MYTSLRGITFVFVLITVLCSLHCTTSHATGPGGTGSETVIGKIVQENGFPAANTMVTIYPEDYDPLLNPELQNNFTDTTDEKGVYLITLKSEQVTGRFRLQAISLNHLTRAIVSSIDLSGSAEFTKVETASLRETGSIKVFVPDSLSDIGYVYIPGTSYNSRVQNGCARLDSVPEFDALQVCYKTASDTQTKQTIATNISIKDNLTTVISFTATAKSKKLYLNTSSDGAGITDTIVGFPLLVRLSQSNFDFNEARSDGSDLRFTKADNTPFPFEIERWEPSMKRAEIWIKLDTVYGASDSQFLVMYWGEAAANMPVELSAVFDTAIGFRGVWHLNEEYAGTGAKGLYKDATGRNNGDDYISATDRSGIIGYGHGFDGIDDYIPLNGSVTNFLKGEGTIALWVNIGDSGGTILSKLDTVAGWNKGEASLYFGDGSNTNEAPGVNGRQPSFVGFHDDYAIAGQSVEPRGWHYLVYTWKWEKDTLVTPKFYVDGNNVFLSRDSLVIRLDESISSTVRIGQPNNNESYAYFNGGMDELEISAVVRSAGWIRLCYVNQLNGQEFLRFVD